MLEMSLTVIVTLSSVEAEAGALNETIIWLHAYLEEGNVLQILETFELAFHID